MFKLDGGERTTLKLGDLIRPEDFDKLYWAIHPTTADDSRLSEWMLQDEI